LSHSATLHRGDGTSIEVELILEPGHLELYFAQLDRMLACRDRYWSGEAR